MALEIADCDSEPDRLEMLTKIEQGTLEASMWRLSWPVRAAITHRRPAGYLAVVVLFLSCGGQNPSPPDLLLISIDTLRADHLGVYGYERDTSPFLDDLANRGIRFENGSVNTHGTPPAHATMLSSLYQETHRVSFDSMHRVPDQVPMVQEILQEAGYKTIGITGGGFVSKKFGFSRGFEVFDDKSRSIDQGVRRLLRQLQSPEDERPVFAFFHTYEVHSPYRPPPPFRGRFGGRGSDFKPTSPNLKKHMANAAALDPETLEFIRSRYDEGILYADHVLKLLFEELEETGFLDSALVIVTSDHGESFGERNLLLHGSELYEELVRVPLLVVGPEVPEGVVESTPRSHVDIAPTLLAAAGLETPELMAGRSLLEAAETIESEEPAVFSQYLDWRYAIRTERWKLIYRPAEERFELFDLRSDPDELHSLAEERGDLVRRLFRRLETWRDGCGELELTRKTAEETDETREQLKALGYLD